MSIDRTNDKEQHDFEHTKNRLNETGCGFCLAKWTQVTMHLNTGRTHSCHHPRTHKIPLRELKHNPTALHNTRFKKKQRRIMKEGGRPAECDYCWNVEDNSNEISDRVYKSADLWSSPYHDEIVELGWKENYNPKYVEVAFSNTCNFKCSYCGPQYSSTWMQEIEKHGAYPTTDRFNDIQHLINDDEMPYRQDEHNPYVEAFWKWWPELYRDLHTFRMTGGEPLLHKDVWKVLDYIIEEKNPNKKLSLSINSNLGVPDALIDKLIEKINRLSRYDDSYRVNDFVVYTSADAWGAHAEYARNGLVFNQWWDNINKILEKCPTVTVGIMSTYNMMSVPTYDKLIEEVYKVKKQYHSNIRAWPTPLSLDASYLRYPRHQTIRILPTDEWAPLVKRQGEIAEQYRDTYHPHWDPDGISWGYTQMEIPKIKRLYDWMIAPQDEEELMTNRRNFYHFINAHDKRRGTDFMKTFPEFEEFYRKCGEIKL